MPLLTGPLFSVSARGKFNKSLVYQGTIRGPTLKRLGGPRPPPTAAQITQQDIVRAAVLAWHQYQTLAAFRDQWALLYAHPPAHQCQYTMFQRDAIRLMTASGPTSFATNLRTTWNGGLYVTAYDLVTGGAAADIAGTEVWSGTTQDTMLSRGLMTLSALITTWPAFATPGTTLYVDLRRNGIPASGRALITFVSYPPNMLSNPGFTTDTIWAKGTGWTISGGLARFASIPGRSAWITQDVSALLPRRSYRVKGTWVTKGCPSECRFQLGGTTGPSYDTTGTAEIDLTSGTNKTVGLTMYGQGTGENTVDDAGLYDFSQPPP